MSEAGTIYAVDLCDAEQNRGAFDEGGEEGAAVERLDCGVEGEHGVVNVDDVLPNCLASGEELAR